MADLESSKHADPIDWEAFYASYRESDFIRGYEILQKLGAGAFGLVFKARKHSIGKDYAIKFLKVDDANVRDAVLHELDTVRLFAQIDHPNLVSIEDMGHKNGIPFIVMGYAGEETLARRQESGKLPRQEALRIFMQVCRGVIALHERMLVHFDLKPANVYLKGDTARVGDYGLSKLVTASRRSLSFGRGTTYYMAPEVLQRQGDHRSDIYSLGVMLYECLVGYVPFRGDSEWEVLKKHESEEPLYPSDLAPSDRAVIESCLRKAPEDRVQSVADVLAILQAPGAAKRNPAPARALAAVAAASASHPPRTRHRRNGRSFMLPVLLAALGLCVLVFLLRADNTARHAFSPTIASQSSKPSRPGPSGRTNSRTAPVAIATRTESFQPALEPAPAATEVREFHDRLDAAIVALQRLREVDVRLPEVRSKALSALGITLRNLDLKSFRGQDPWTEALVQAVKAGLEKDDVRARWGELIDTIVPPAPKSAR